MTATPFNGGNMIAAAKTIQPLTPYVTLLTGAALSTGGLTVACLIGVAPSPNAQPGFPDGAVNFQAQVDTEDVLVTAGQSTTAWTTTRAQNSTSAATHASGAIVKYMGRSGAGWSQAPSAITIANSILIEAHPLNSGVIGVAFASSGWTLNETNTLLPGEWRSYDTTFAALTSGVYIMGSVAGDGVTFVGS